MSDNRVPEGIYPAVAVPMDGEDGTHLVRWANTKEKNKQVLVYFEILEGDYRGQRLPWFGFFTKASYERTMQALRFMGWKGDDLANLGDLDQEVSITVEHNTYNEKTYARVAWVNRAGGGSAMKLNDPLSESDVRAFAARFRVAAGKIATVEGKRVQREAAPRPSNGPAQRSFDEFPGGPFDDAPMDGAGAHGGTDDVPF